MIPFNSIPGNLRVPLFFAEVNPGGSPAQSLAKLLLIGQKISTGTATVDQPIMVSGNEDGLFGRGSMLGYMYRAARRNAPLQEIWALPLADIGTGGPGGVKATGSITVGAVATVTGQLTVYIGGQRVRLGVSPSSTQAQIATALAAAINAGDTTGNLVPVTAVVDGTDATKVNLTARHTGTLGNFISVITDYRGDEGPLAAIMLTIVAMASGATDPDVTAKLANLADIEFDFIASPYVDSTNIGAITAFLNNASGRWGPLQQLYGGHFTAKANTQGNLATYGLTLNDPHLSVMGYYNSPSGPWEWAAAYGAVAAAYLSDPTQVSRPLHTLVLEGLLPPKLAGDRFSVTQRQALYYDGIASYHVNAAGQVCIDRAVTTYQKNDWSVPDASWLDVETLYQSAYVIRYLKGKVTSTWGRASLRDTNPQGLIGVATPDNIKDTIIHGYRELSNQNLVDNVDLFAAALIVERNHTDPNRVDVFLPPDLVNQLRIVAVNVTTFLQLPNAA